MESLPTSIPLLPTRLQNRSCECARYVVCVSSLYEKKFHALKFAEMTPLELLLSFMDDHALKQVDIGKVLDVSSGVMSEIANGKRDLFRNGESQTGARGSADYEADESC